jgi:hypothetical protein
MFAHKPNSNKARTNWVELVVVDRSTRVSGYSKEAMSITGFVPNLADSHADKGKLINCPTGNANSTRPNPASVKCNAFLISGILLAHVEKVSPAVKKNALTAILYIRGCIVNAVFIIIFFVHNNLIGLSPAIFI